MPTSTVEELLEAMRALIEAAGEEELSEDDQERYEDLERQLAVARKSQEIRSRQEAYETPTRTDLHVYATNEGEKEQELRAFETFLKTGVQTRALTTGTDASGGYLVPELFRSQVVETLKEFGGVREVANVITTASGQNLEWPTFDGTAQLGEIVAENTQVTELDPAFGTNSLDSYLYSTKLVRVPIQLMQDSAFSMTDFLSRALAERVARITNQHYTTGTGTGQPDGIATSPTVGVTAASGTAITSDEIIDLVHSVDLAYRANGRFMLSDAVLADIRKLKDSNGAYIWQPSMQAGVPSSLFGYPVTINQDMDQSLAVNDIAVLFGDFRRGYVIRDVSSFELLVLRERYADFHQVGFLGFLRTDGTKSDTGAYKALQMAAV